MNETGLNTSAFRQLIEPDPVRYSFNTPGWYAVLLLLLIVFALVAFFQYRKYRKNAYRREALRKLNLIESSEPERLIYNINLLLKTMAMSLFGRTTVAALTGSEWFAFLASKLTKEPELNESSVKDFTQTLYNESYILSENQSKEFVDFARLWIQKHQANV